MLTETRLVTAMTRYTRLGVKDPAVFRKEMGRNVFLEVLHLDPLRRLWLGRMVYPVVL